MIGRTVGHYRILEKIGAGGMGEVYRARDEHLARDVALKVLHAGTLTDETARKRFRKEALVLSKLNHPNIATVHDFDTQDGMDFLVMELVPGEPLKEKLHAGTVKQSEILRLGLQLAEGLAAAHEQGVVHRDLKPGNLLITPDGRVKILDFGLARLLPVADSDATRSLTETRVVAGTFPYMSPEQLQGESLDARTDIYAAGAVLYEMATSQLPFEGKTLSALTDAILHKAPASPASLNPKLSPKLEDVILKCLEKEPGDRYQSAKELAVALRRLAAPSAVVAAIPARRSGARPLRTAMIVAPSVLALLAVLFAMNPGGWRDRLLRGARLPKIQSLAVLPLQNLSHDPEQEYFADGMTEALITDLSKIRALKVISRTSVMRYKGVTKPLPEIARELGVDGIVEGSVQRSGGKVLITAQLIGAPSDTHLWAESYERDFRDVLTLQGEVAQAIAREIKVAVTPEEATRLARVRAVNPEAYDACLKGRLHYYRLSREELDIAEHYFQLALDKDPQYALAHVGIADVWGARGDAGFLPIQETRPKMKAAVSKALELDDSLAEAHISLANYVYIGEWAWPQAEKEFQRAIQLNPSYADAHFFYADFLISMGRTEEWKAEIQRTLELDPLNFFYRVFYGWQLVYVRRYDEAITQLRRVLEEVPNSSSAHLGLWGAFYKKRMEHEALTEARKFFEVLHDAEVVEALDRGYAEGGYRRAMKRAGDKLAARAEQSHVSAIRIARVYAHAGEKERALDWLEKSYERRETTLIHVAVGWDWDDLRGDPRFQSLLRRMNFPQ